MHTNNPSARQSAISVGSKYLSLMDWFVVGVLALSSTTFLAALQLAPSDPEQGVAVVFPPWISNRDAMTRAASAGGTFLRMGRYSFIVIARPRSRAYVRRVLAGGALAVLEPWVLGCAARRGAI